MKVADVMRARRNRELDAIELDQAVMNHKQYRANRQGIPDTSEQDEIDHQVAQIRRAAGIPPIEEPDDGWLLEVDVLGAFKTVAPAASVRKLGVEGGR